MLNKIISENYPLDVKKLTLLDKHFGTEIFLVYTDKGKYIIKTLPLYVNNIENEGYVTEFLYNHGISVARLLKTNDGTYHVKTDEMQFHVQEFIEGETLRVNTAPDWFIEKCACTLGRIHQDMSSYGELHISFGADFFDKSVVTNAKHYYSERLNSAIDKKDSSLISELQERVRHLERISGFRIDASRLTYSNSHGDFHIGQIITHDEDITVIDWTSACRLPVALEVIVSYITADPACSSGKIDADRFKRYIDTYLKYFSLNEYNIKIMPYLYYYQQILCHYQPPYRDVADGYKPVCELINSVTGWLYENIDCLHIV